MSPSRNLWVNWILPAAVIAVLVVSALAWRSKPPSTLICRTWASSAATLTAVVPSETPAWHFHATFDRGLKPPGPEWRLFEGAEPDTGYELRWLPQRLAIQLFHTGEHPQLLASAELERVPREIDFTRHGLRLTVAVDGIETIRVADLLPAPAPSAWGFQAATGMGEVMLSVYDDAAMLDDGERRLLEDDAAALVADAADPAIDVAPIARARQAVGLDAKLELDVEHAQAQAELALTALMSYEDDRLSCSAWLAWNRVRLALARDDAEGTDRAAAGVAALVRISREPPFGQELPGLLMQLLPLLADRAAQRPERPTPPEQVLAQRERWLGLIAEIGYAVMDIRERDLVTTENLHWQLRLLRHGAECLAGKSAEPTPA
ncbi:MAG: hypothetical protein H0W72_08790, partial [Planctomycetes bacterium]|nr:hypothetical protein [Planctomycetota bacterium]